MYIFIDSADTDKLKTALDSFPVDGVTTNPTILSREKRELMPLLAEIRSICGERKMFVQAISHNADEMIREAHAICDKIGGNLCIKIPMTAQGIRAIMKLSSDGIETTATAVYSASQALIAAKAGAKFVAPYLSHLDNLSIDSAAAAGDMAKLIKLAGLETMVLAASFRTVEQVTRVIAAGAQAVTVTPEMLETMLKNPGTSAEIDSFDKNWSEVYGGNGISQLLF
ncbi:MAG: transaldolase family protein [Eubacteriales bacterium]